MDFELPRDDDPRRLEVRAWFEARPRPTGRELAEAGYATPHWPKPWGLEADPELARRLLTVDFAKCVSRSDAGNVVLSAHNPCTDRHYAQLRKPRE